MRSLWFAANPAADRRLGWRGDGVLDEPFDPYESA
jgi:hypothetical protein